jgi:GTP cyclohydrolase FolE2
MTRRPTAAGAGHPNSRSAARFQWMIRPSSPISANASRTVCSIATRELSTASRERRAVRSSSSVMTLCARSQSASISSAAHSRGVSCSTHNDPSVFPAASVSGAPAYAITPSSSIARFSRSRGTRRASDTTSGS